MVPLTGLSEEWLRVIADVVSDYSHLNLGIFFVKVLCLGTFGFLLPLLFIVVFCLDILRGLRFFIQSFICFSLYFIWIFLVILSEKSGYYLLVITIKSLFLSVFFSLLIGVWFLRRNEEKLSYIKIFFLVAFVFCYWFFENNVVLSNDSQKMVNDQSGKMQRSRILVVLAGVPSAQGEGLFRSEELRGLVPSGGFLSEEIHWKTRIENRFLFEILSKSKNSFLGYYSDLPHARVFDFNALSENSSALFSPNLKLFYLGGLSPEQNLSAIYNRNNACIWTAKSLKKMSLIYFFRHSLVHFPARLVRYFVPEISCQSSWYGKFSFLENNLQLLASEPSPSQRILYVKSDFWATNRSQKKEMVEFLQGIAGTLKSQKGRDSGDVIVAGWDANGAGSWIFPLIWKGNWARDNIHFTELSKEHIWRNLGHWIRHEESFIDDESHESEAFQEAKNQIELWDPLPVAESLRIEEVPSSPKDLLFYEDLAAVRLRSMGNGEHEK